MRLRIAICASVVALAPALAQQPYAPKAISTEDYARAEKYLAPGTNPLVSGGSVNANWLPDERLWYRNTTATGGEVILVDPARKTRTVCDATLSNCPGVPADANTAGAGGGGRGGRGGLPGGGGRGGRGGNAGPPLTMSPDGKLGAFIKAYNLWVRDIATNSDRQLTTDGVKDFGYATDNAGWASSDRAVLLWSPDSKKIGRASCRERV